MRFYDSKCGKMQLLKFNIKFYKSPKMHFFAKIWRVITYLFLTGLARFEFLCQVCCVGCNKFNQTLITDLSLSASKIDPNIGRRIYSN